MHETIQKLQSLELDARIPHDIALTRIRNTLESELKYHFFEVDEGRPWGAFYRIIDEEADRFLAEFFPGLDPADARLGNRALLLSPKILVVYPGQRLSWQYHRYRSERWHFLTPGGYYKSSTDEQGALRIANIGDDVQFKARERHRLVGVPESYTLVAEIWQHTDPTHPSEESDIIRLADDYKR